MNLNEEELKAARMGEFQELTWEIEIELKPHLDNFQRVSVLDQFSNFAQASELGIGIGLGTLHTSFFVVSLNNRKQVTAEEQQLLTDWLLQRPEVVHILREESDKQFWDAWHVMLVANAYNEAFDTYFSE